ncbi:hypothetical protein ADT27_13420 [Xanthomonas oryzae]|uniref:hypothetical protein n=1 Tax=Xanthomonas oryzae TaxID=347 RepID=UPI0006AC33A1|nr:hypothetical protein [Xanthomonas oryzae]KOR44991.1 hypothetical protein ADT27_13420 [Xanthomonas oryzae]
MSDFASKLAEKIAKAKAVGPDMTKPSKGGGYKPPEAGRGARLRFVGYFELGTHTEKSGEFAGKKNKKVRLVFELSGKNWTPKEVNGESIPHRITLNMNYSLNEKATYYKTFMQLRKAHGDKATTMAELLGAAFLGDVEHKTSKSGNVYPQLVNIRKAERETEDGEFVPVAVPEPLTELKVFIWDIADMEMWESIYIPGTYDSDSSETGDSKPRSKNVLQEMIRSAEDWHTCPISALVDKGAAGKDIEKSLDKVLEDTAIVGDEPDLDLI